MDEPKPLPPSAIEGPFNVPTGRVLAGGRDVEVDPTPGNAAVEGVDYVSTVDMDEWLAMTAEFEG